MWDIYDGLIDGVEPCAAAERVCRGQWRAWVESDGCAGLASLLLKDKAPAEACRLPQYEGRPLRELAQLVKSWDPLEAAVGLAAINAWYNRPETLRALGAEIYPPGMEQGDVFQRLLPYARGRRVATIGHFQGVRELYAGQCDFTVFEREPRPGDMPDTAEEYLLPQMELVFVTGMAFTNKTMPRLLELAAQARLVLTGPSVPLTPLLLGYGADMLSGAVVLDVAGCRRSVLQDQGGGYFRHAGKVLLEQA